MITTLVSLTAIATFVVAYVLISVFKHKTESEKTYLRLVDVKQATTDPAPWAVNWPSEYDQYLRTSEASKTNFGGGDAQPNQKSQVFPFLTPMFQGYAFSLDYRDRRGHSFMLFDQKNRPEAERAAQAKLAQNADYAKMDAEAKAKKLTETTQAKLNELWAK